MISQKYWISLYSLDGKTGKINQLIRIQLSKRFCLRCTICTQRVILWGTQKSALMKYKEKEHKKSHSKQYKERKIEREQTKQSRDVMAFIYWKVSVLGNSTSKLLRPHFNHFTLIHVGTIKLFEESRWTASNYMRI